MSLLTDVNSEPFTSLKLSRVRKQQMSRIYSWPRCISSCFHAAALQIDAWRAWITLLGPAPPPGVWSSFDITDFAGDGATYTRIHVYTYFKYYLHIQWRRHREAFYKFWTRGIDMLDAGSTGRCRQLSMVPWCRYPSLLGTSLCLIVGVTAHPSLRI